MTDRRSVICLDGRGGACDAYLSLDQDDEAWRFGTIARDTSSSDDVVSQAGGRAIQARVLSRRAEHEGGVVGP